MGLRQTVSEWIAIAKDALDFGPEFPTALEGHRVGFVDKVSQLQALLEQARKASQEKDKLIARLQAAGGNAGNMVVDGPVYFIRKGNTLEGPYCTSCFEHHHETARVVSAAKPKGADGPSTDWVQCPRCRTPFCSERISRYLNPRPAAPAQVAVPSEGEGETPSAKTRNPRAPSRRRKKPQSEPTETLNDSTQSDSVSRSPDDPAVAT